MLERTSKLYLHAICLQVYRLHFSARGSFAIGWTEPTELFAGNPRIARQDQSGSEGGSIRRSSRRVQQTQPLENSTSCSSVRLSVPWPWTIAASMLIWLISLTMTATLSPSRLASTWFSTATGAKHRNGNASVVSKAIDAQLHPS